MAPQFYTYSLNDLSRMLLREITKREREDMFYRGFEEHNEKSERYLKIIISSNVICVFENDIRIREREENDRRKKERAALRKNNCTYYKNNSGD